MKQSSNEARFDKMSEQSTVEGTDNATRKREGRGVVAENKEIGRAHV